MPNKKVRQLAAIMFTDIVGYTALMEGDEKLAISVRARHRQVFEQEHSQHNGEIVQYYGDGSLSIFKSAIEAAKCAIEIQRQLQIGQKVPLRIGIHVGDIVFNKTEVYGDGVNFASRIESMSVAGAILISSRLHDELKNQHDISTTSLGQFELKNVAKPVEVFAITNEGIMVPKRQQLKGKQKSTNKTIAVLPFSNMSTSEENEYFSDGITEEIINALSKIKSLKVTSRTSSFFFKNKNVPIKKIGKELGVSTILEGSVRLSGNMLRITAQLIQAEEDFHFWSETWDRKLDNIFEIQDEISLIIADKLREQFGHFEIQEHLVEKQTDSIDAYEYSLKAKFHKNKWNPEDVKMAISLYEKALQIDPNHTESHLGLADCYGFMGNTGFLPFAEAWAKTNQFINQALKLNSQLSGAHYQLSNQAFFVECNYKKSLQEMTKAIQMNPSNAEAQQFISFLYIIAGEIEKAQEHLDISMSINPLSEETQFFKGYFHYMVEDYEKSLELLDRCLEVNDKNIPAISVKSLCLLKLKRYEEVISFFETIPPDVVIIGEKTGAIALAYALKKDVANTAIYLSLLKEQAKEPNGFTADSYLLLLYSVLGKNDLAFEWVENAIATNSPLLLLRFSDPLANGIKDDPRYAEIHKSIYQKEVSVNTEKEMSSPLSKELSLSYVDKLLDHITTKKPFLDPNLSLRSLAEQISIDPNQLSWLLNDSLGKNFSEFINHYRVEAFKKIAKNPKKARSTLMEVAFSCGFNSETVFNTCFKQTTGLSPKQFIKT